MKIIKMVGLLIATLAILYIIAASLAVFIQWDTSYFSALEWGEEGRAVFTLIFFGCCTFLVGSFYLT